MEKHDPGLEPLFEFTNYERVVQFNYDASKFDLSRMHAILSHLGNPQAAFPAVHVGGTKGKGSTARFTAAILTAAGVRTGLFTSPHLERMEERFQIDGRAIPTAELVDLVQMIVPYLRAAEPKPTFFEIITAIAWEYFRHNGVEVPVMEVGLGGRLDSTNVIDPAVCVITNIGLDHTRQLGDTVEQIAWEKAGIIKEGVPVVTAERPGPGLEVIRRRAEESRAPLIVVGEPLHVPLRPPGRHQGLNAACAAEAIGVLNKKGITDVGNDQIRSALAAAHLPGCIEVVAEAPTIIIDCAHNDTSARALAATLTGQFRYERLILVFGILADKRIDAVLDELIPHCACVIVTRCPSPRTIEPAELAARIRDRFGEVDLHVCEEPAAALAQARALAAAADLICVTGSTYLAGELRSLIGY